MAKTITPIKNDKKRKVGKLTDDKPKVTDSVSIVEPTLTSVIEDTIAIITNEITYYKNKVIEKNMRLTSVEVAIVSKFAKSLVELSREDREREKNAESLAGKSEDELLEELRRANDELEKRNSGMVKVD